jgi:dolichyl-phosphate-mannose-protein mannosyltransferase
MEWIAAVRRHAKWLVIAGYVGFAAAFGTVKLDVDEFKIVKEPYELLGGDYTVGYLKAHEFGNALDCAARSYRFYWQYRPRFSPVIAEHDRTLFAAEERRFGYVPPDQTSAKTLVHYQKRLIVPEPDRFYRYGAGEGLLAQLLRIPSLALFQGLAGSGRVLLELQFTRNYHWLFLVLRLQGLVAGALCLLLVHRILAREAPSDGAWLGVAWLAVLPPVLAFFPNLHFDAIMAPLLLLAATLFVRGRHVAGGIAFGLALAAKNTAVFLLPAALAFVAWEIAEAHRGGGWPAARERLRRRAVGLSVFSLMALVSLAPFANPVSMAREILTPVIAQPFDARGVDVGGFSLASRFGVEPAAPGVVPQRRIVLMIRQLVGTNMRMLMLLIGLPLAWSRITRPLNRLGFFFLLLVFPYALVFGDGLGYRSLMFLPFFALIAAEVLGRRMLLATIAAFLLVDLVFVVDPISSTGLTYAASTGTTSVDAQQP